MDNHALYNLATKAIIQNDAGEILLLHAHPHQGIQAAVSYWDLPGGRAEEGAAILETLAREITEETGLTMTGEPTYIAAGISHFSKMIDDRPVGLVLFAYRCMVADISAIKLSDEHHEFQWTPPQKAADLLHVKYPQEFCEAISKL